MKTAIIVSGALRYLPEASSSWKFNADYFLCIDSSFYEPQDPESKGSILSLLENQLSRTQIPFKAVSISTFQHNELTLRNTALKMLWKWKMSYYMFLPYHQLNRYERILLIRPDLYIRSEDFILPDVADGEIFVTNPPHIDERNRAWVNDIFSIMTPATFSKLKDSYEFILGLYQNTTPSYGSNIHNYLYNFYSQNCIDIRAPLGNFDFCPIRQNCLALFQNNKLMKDKTFDDLAAESMNWWKEKWKT